MLSTRAGPSRVLLRDCTLPINRLQQNANVCKSPQEDQVTEEQVQDEDMVVVVGGKLLLKLCKVIVLTIIRYQTLLPTI